jgi:hypothetical protein
MNEDKEFTMKFYPFPISVVDPARLLRAIVPGTLRVLLFSLAFSSASLLHAASTTLQNFHMPLSFEQNRGQAPGEVKWLGRSSNYRVLVEKNGLTLLLPDKENMRTMAGPRRFP